MYDEWMPMPRYKLRKRLVKSILKRESLENKSCLEIGYGSGDMLLMFSRMGLHADGYDFSPLAYQNAKTRITESIKLIDQENEIKKNAYDYLMAFEVLEHIQQDEMALKRFGSYLKRNGKLMISVPAHTSKWGKSDICVGHYRRYEKKELKKKLKAANFYPIFFWSYGYPLSLLLDLMMNKSYAKNFKKKIEIQRESLSKESGVKRKKSLFNQIASNDILLIPFFMIQKFFLTSDLGSGYLIVAEKIK